MSVRITDPPAAAHPKIVEMLDYWRGLADRKGALPSRGEIDPTEIPRLLENVWLLDVVGAPPRFRFRLIGEALRRLGIGAKRGDFADEVIDAEAPPLQDLRFVVAEQRPVWFRGKATVPHEAEMFELERLFLPLASDGATVDVILCLSVFYTLKGAPI
jgi:hypothetical protein